MAVGVQEKTPVIGLMAAPAGAPASKLKVRVWAGLSASVALAVKESGVPDSIVLLPIPARTGGVLVGSLIPMMA